MELAEVRQVLAQAIRESQVSSPAENRVIAVVDREGHVLAVWDVNGAAATGSGPANVAAAVAKAGTAAYLSSNQHAFTTRTAGFIIQQHFPPEVRQPSERLACRGRLLKPRVLRHEQIPRSIAAAGKHLPSSGGSGKQSGGGYPECDSGRRVSGAFRSPLSPRIPAGWHFLGTESLSAESAWSVSTTQAVEGFDISFKGSVNERIALSGQAGFRPNPALAGSKVSIDGLRVAYQVETGSNTVAANPAMFLADPVNGQSVFLMDIDGMLGSADDGAVDYSPKASPPAVVYPNPFGLTGKGGVPGQLRSAIRADPMPGTISGQPRLTAAEVESIIRLAAERSVITRAGIRLPRGQIARVWITVVNNPFANQVEPVILGTYRTPDATIFSWDVSSQKARTALFFSRGLEREPFAEGFFVQSGRLSRPGFFPTWYRRDTPGAVQRRSGSGFPERWDCSTHASQFECPERDHDFPRWVSALQKRSAGWCDRCLRGRDRAGRYRSGKRSEGFPRAAAEPVGQHGLPACAYSLCEVSESGDELLRSRIREQRAFAPIRLLRIRAGGCGRFRFSPTAWGRRWTLVRRLPSPGSGVRFPILARQGSEAGNRVREDCPR